MTVYAWLIKGLSGVVSLLEEMTTHGERMEDAWLGQLAAYVDRLTQVVRQQEARR